MSGDNSGKPETVKRRASAERKAMRSAPLGSCRPQDVCADATGLTRPAGIGQWRTAT